MLPFNSDNTEIHAKLFSYLPGQFYSCIHTLDESHLENYIYIIYKHGMTFHQVIFYYVIPSFKRPEDSLYSHLEISSWHRCLKSVRETTLITQGASKAG